MSENNGLPKRWTEATLGDLITLTQNGFGKRSQESGRPTVVLRLADITDGEITLADPRRVNATPEEIQQYGLKPDDLLAIRVNGSPDIVGRVVRFVGADQPVLFCDHFIHLRLPESGLARYLRYFADTRAVRRFVEENKVSSAGQNTVNQSTLMRLAVPIAPLPEQHRIVEKVEELFSDLDAGVASLQRAKANLKRYRASVLKSAVEGRLTEEWRKEHSQAEDGQMLLDLILRERREKWERDQLQKFREKGKEPPKNWESKYEEPSAPDTSELPELPEGWTRASLDMLLRESLRNGHSARTSEDGRGVRTISITAVTYDAFTEDNIKYTIADPTFVEDLWLEPGDILIQRSNTPELVGTARLFTGESRFAIFPDLLIRIRTTPAISERFIALLLQASATRYYFRTHAKGMSGSMPKIDQGTVLECPVPLPPLAEQEQIVALVDERLSQIDAAEKTIDAELTRSKRLRQSILKRAFEGKLVPQDPKDEPASVLLDRIKAGREAEQPKKKSKKVKAK